MRVAVLGGTGFIGRHVTRQLLESGAEVVTIERGTSDPRELVAPSLNADRHDADALRNALAAAGPAVVIDMIAYEDRDIEGLLDTIPNSVGRLVVISSGDVYATYGALIGLSHDHVESGPSDERSRLRTAFFPYRREARGPDDWLFSYEKILVERAAKAWRGGSTTILRLPMVYGPHDRRKRVAKYLEKFSTTRSVRVNPAQAAWRATRGYVEDVGAAIARAAMSEAAAGETFNVGEPDALTEAEWARAIAQVSGWDGEIMVDPAEAPDEDADWNIDLVVDTSRIRKLLGFNEPFGREAGLKRTVASVNE